MATCSCYHQTTRNGHQWFCHQVSLSWTVTVHGWPAVWQPSPVPTAWGCTKYFSIVLSRILRKVSMEWHVQKSIQKLTDPTCEATEAAKAPTARHITRSYTIKQCHVHYCIQWRRAKQNCCLKCLHCKKTPTKVWNHTLLCNSSYCFWHKFKLHCKLYTASKFQQSKLYSSKATELMDVGTSYWYR